MLSFVSVDYELTKTYFSIIRNKNTSEIVSTAVIETRFLRAVERKTDRSVFAHEYLDFDNLASRYRKGSILTYLCVK